MLRSTLHVFAKSRQASMCALRHMALVGVKAGRQCQVCHSDRGAFI